MAVLLAGQVGLESAVPLIIARLNDDFSDVLFEACICTLTQLGTPAVVEAVARAYPVFPHPFWLDATDPLGQIHSNLAVEKVLELLAMTEETEQKYRLANALLCQFASEGIEESRKLLKTPEEAEESICRHHLLNRLMDTNAIMGQSFPEY